MDPYGQAIKMPEWRTLDDSAARLLLTCLHRAGRTGTMGPFRLRRADLQYRISPSNFTRCKKTLLRLGLIRRCWYVKRESGTELRRQTRDYFWVREPKGPDGDAA